jgi:LysM repeat protein
MSDRSVRTSSRFEEFASPDMAADKRPRRSWELVTVVSFTAAVLLALLGALVLHIGSPQTHAAGAVSAPASRPAVPAPGSVPAPGHVAPVPAAGAPAPVVPGGPGLVRTHVVRPGETLARLAVRYGVDYRRIAVDNGLPDPNLVRAGRMLRIGPPTPGVRVVQPGQTLSGLAVESGTSVRRLLTLNPWITDPDLIPAGAGLRVRA